MACTKCHSAAPHADRRLNAHLASVSCQACHIPQYAVERATKMTWDWSAAGKDLPITDPHEYMKIKGAFTWAKDVVPFYYWYNGRVDRYVPGDQIDPRQRTLSNSSRCLQFRRSCGIMSICS